MLSRWLKAMVRSPRHSSTMTSSLPRLTRSTAGSSRSEENPAPVPMRMLCGEAFIALARRSVASVRGILREEQVGDAGRGALDRADLGHELCGLEDFFRFQRIGVILVVDDRDNVIDGILGVVSDLEV